MPLLLQPTSRWLIVDAPAATAHLQVVEGVDDRRAEGQGGVVPAGRALARALRGQAATAATAGLGDGAAPATLQAGSERGGAGGAAARGVAGQRWPGNSSSSSSSSK